ncbi:CBS domain-containing protein [Leeia oryzae]|uniref:CBS domain-containing protein n=1 Tax=Leeia oryzae TaxID=356662 RepID=UPI0003A95484|nr:CBS domain-containing protein [Leeia oryzae]
MASPSLMSELKRDLQQHAPFDAMASEDINWLIERLGVKYFPQGAVIMSAGELPDCLYIVRRGEVKSEDSARKAALHALSPGELFPLGALLGQRPTLSTFRAETDGFCYHLPVADFNELRARSAAFQDFCTRRIAHLLDLSRQRLQTTYASHVAQQTLDIPLRDVAHAPITCLPTASVRDVLTLMRQKRIGSMVIVDQDGKAKGIFTLHDLLRLTLENIALTDPISTHMSIHLVHLPPTHRAFDAAVVMARHGIHHLLVMDGDELQGIVSERDLFGLQRVSLNQLAQTILHAESNSDFKLIHRDLLTLQRNMLAQGIGAEQLARGLATLVDQVLTRVIQLEKPAEVTDEDAYTWLVLGAHGRLEASVDSVPELMLANRDGQLAEWHAQWRDRVLNRLTHCGWKDATVWVVHGTLGTRSMADAMDARWICGSAALAQSLKAQAERDWKYRLSTDNQLPAMLLANLSPDTQPNAPIQEFLPLGLSAFIDGARLLAVLEDVSITNTAERLRLVAARLRLSDDTTTAWIEAFHFMWMLPLANPVKEAANEKVVILNDLDRRILKEALRQARKLQEQIQRRFSMIGEV